jgi:hypothetical protein
MQASRQTSANSARVMHRKTSLEMAQPTRFAVCIHTAPYGKLGYLLTQIQDFEAERGGVYHFSPFRKLSARFLTVRARVDYTN